MWFFQEYFVQASQLYQYLQKIYQISLKKINFIKFNRNTNYIKYFHNYTHKYEQYSTIKPTQLPHKHIIKHYKNFIIKSRKAKLCSDI